MKQFQLALFLLLNLFSTSIVSAEEDNISFIEKIISESTPIPIKDFSNLGYVHFVETAVSCVKREGVDDYDIKDFISEITYSLENIYFEKDKINNINQLKKTITYFVLDNELELKNCSVESIVENIPKKMANLVDSKELSVEGLTLEMSPEEMNKYIDEFLKTPEGIKHTKEIKRLKEESKRLKENRLELQKLLGRINAIIGKVEDK